MAESYGDCCRLSWTIWSYFGFLQSAGVNGYLDGSQESRTSWVIPSLVVTDKTVASTTFFFGLVEHVCTTPTPAVRWSLGVIVSEVHPSYCGLEPVTCGIFSRVIWEGRQRTILKAVFQCLPTTIFSGPFCSSWTSKDGLLSKVGTDYHPSLRISRSYPSIASLEDWCVTLSWVS